MTAILLIASALFCAGVFGLLTQKHAIGLMIAIEVMINAANLVLVGLGQHKGAAVGQSFALFTIAIAVAEVVVGLAIVLLLYRSRGDVQVDEAQEMRQ